MIKKLSVTYHVDFEDRNMLLEFLASKGYRIEQFGPSGKFPHVYDERNGSNYVAFMPSPNNLEILSLIEGGEELERMIRQKPSFS